MNNAKKKENRRSFNVMLSPKVKSIGAKLAFNDNLSFSRFVENLILKAEKEQQK